MVSSGSRTNRIVVKDGAGGRMKTKAGEKGEGTNKGGSRFSGMAVQPYRCTEFKRVRHSKEMSSREQGPKFR